jgi:hypothetical protein
MGWVDLRIPQITDRQRLDHGKQDRAELSSCIGDGEPTRTINVLPCRAPLPGGDFPEVGLLLRYSQSIDIITKFKNICLTII